MPHMIYYDCSLPQLVPHRGMSVPVYPKSRFGIQDQLRHITYEKRVQLRSFKFRTHAEVSGCVVGDDQIRCRGMLLEEIKMSPVDSIHPRDC